MPRAPTPAFVHCHSSATSRNKGTGGSFARVRWSWSRRLTMLMKEAILKTEMERLVSLRIERRGWVRW
jgi:hypothetical protein